MPRSLRQSAFRRRADIGEDVNPSAYIVNLADCMLVLACGFMVALIAYWNVDISTSEKIDDTDMTPVSPDTIPENVDQGGTGYVEAGKVYRDPTTGELYMVPSDGQDAGDSSSSSSSAANGSSSASTSSASGSSPAQGSAGSGASKSSGASSAGSTAGGAPAQSINDARAGGAD